MTKSIERIAGLIIEGTVTSEYHPIVAKAHISYQNLCIRIDALIIIKFIRVKKHNARAFLARRRRPTNCGPTPLPLSVREGS